MAVEEFGNLFEIGLFRGLFRHGRSSWKVFCSVVIPRREIARVKGPGATRPENGKSVVRGVVVVNERWRGGAS